MKRASLGLSLCLLAWFSIAALGCSGPGGSVSYVKNPEDTAIEALPASAFIYADADGYFYKYDTTNDTATKLSDFKYAPLYDLALFSISPNRKWIAFPAAPDAKDLYWNNASAPGLYAMSVDGKQVKKILPAIPAPGLTTCDSGGSCREGSCNKANNTCSGFGTTSITPTQLRWSHDNTSIWFKLSFSDANLNGGNALVGVNLTDGTVTELATQLPCLFFQDPAPHPTKNELLIYFYGKGYGCSIDAGLYLYNHSTKQAAALPGSAGSWVENLTIGNFNWTEDGTGIFYTQGFSGATRGLYIYDVAKAAKAPLFTNEKVDVVHFVLAPTPEKKALLCYQNLQNKTYEAIILDLTNTDNSKGVRLPNKCHVDW